MCIIKRLSSVCKEINRITNHCQVDLSLKFRQRLETFDLPSLRRLSLAIGMFKECKIFVSHLKVIHKYAP